MGTRDDMDPTPGNGNTQAETEGDGNNMGCMCMGNEMHGAARARGVTQSGGAAWAGARVGEARPGEARVGEARPGEARPWGARVGALPWGPPVWLLRAREHWRRLIVHRASRACQIALRLHTGRYRRGAYG
jgi:hypothetical protein